MPSFHFQALNQSGRKQSGVVEADSERSARQQLRQQGLAPLSLSAATEGRTRSTTRLSIMERAALTRQLATLARAAIPLDDALQAVMGQHEQKKIQSIISVLHSQINEGRPLHQAMESFPYCFPQDYCATVRAGEESGHLGTVLERLADHSEQQQQTRQKVVMALIYPGMILLIALLVVTLLLVHVVPQIIEVVQQNNQTLPALTRYLINSSNFLQHHGGTLILLLFAIVALLRYLYQKEGIRFQLHRLLLRVPLLRHFLRTYYATHFTRTLGMLLASGVPILNAMQTTKAVINNLWLQSRIDLVTVQIREGESIYNALQRQSILPSIPLHLIASGESGGNLGEMVIRAAENQQQELERSIALSLSLLEPLMILLMGGVILMIVLAILLPIFEMNQLIQ